MIMANIEHYLNARESGLKMEEIQKKFALSEATVYCWEIGYQCYLKRLPLDKCLELLKMYKRKGDKNE